jgi:hypothetical protein
MSLSRARFDEALTILRLRGVVVGTERAEHVFRLVEHRPGLTWQSVFDELRSAGCAVSFTVERGLIRTMQQNDELKAARNRHELERIRRAREAMERTEPTSGYSANWIPRRVTRVVGGFTR